MRLGDAGQQQREVARQQVAVADETDARRTRVEFVVAQAEPPPRIELVHALHVPAVLLAAIRVAEPCPVDVVSEQSVLGATHVFRLQLERLATRAGRGRPLQRRVDDPRLGTAGERVHDVIAEAVDVLVGTVLGVHVHPRHSRAPPDRVTEVATDVREQRRAVEPVATQARTRELAAVARFRAELEEQVRRREPLHLHAVLAVLPAIEGLVHERLVDEVPGVRVDFVEVTEAGEEAPSLDREPRRQRRGASERFFDADFAFGRQGHRQRRGEVRINARRERHFGLAEVEAAVARPDLASARHEAGEVEVTRVLRQVGVVAGQDHRDRRIERRGTAGWCRRGRRRRFNRCSRGGGHRCCRLQLIDAGFERSYTLRVFGLERGDLGTKRLDVVGGLNGGRGDHGGNGHGPNDSGKVSHWMILVECRQTGRRRASAIERIDRSARRSACEKGAARGAQHRGVDATGSQRTREREGQEDDDGSAAGHGQQWRVRDAFLAEAGALAGRQLLVGPAGGMAELVQQRRRLREQERNQREDGEPMATGRTQDDSLRCRAPDTSAKPRTPLAATRKVL